MSPDRPSGQPEPVAARVNGVPLAAADEVPSATELRRRACTELLRQQALRTGLLAPHDPPPLHGATSEAASAAIEQLLEHALTLPEPDIEACRRHHAAHPARFATGERVQVRHVLFAVTPGVDVNALRRRAESCLLELGTRGGEHFAAVARELSNCPSGADGGELGWLQDSDCAPEFAREVFGRTEVGLLPRLVHSRHGLHVVEVLARQRGRARSFEQVASAVAQDLRQRLYVTAVRQYLQALASQARLEGVEIDTQATPLLQ